MSRVRSFFIEEAEECLATLTAAAPGDPDVAGLHAAVRRLRGSAQIARYGPVAEAALPLERRLKALLHRQGQWTEATAREVKTEVAAVARAVDAVRDGRIKRESKPEERMAEQQGTADAEVAIDELEYRGRAALDRALELRTPLEDALVADEGVGPILDELFDLIRLGIV